MFTLRMITNQNYFEYEGKFYKPNLGVAMGSPLSGILAEIFLQDLEQHRIKRLLECDNITYYNRYIDDFFIIYNQTKITPHTITEHFNAQHKELQFTINEELNNQITHLDLNLTNRQGQIEMEVFGKPTATDVKINKKSCHPKEHKLSAYRRELNTIIHLALNNGYNKDGIIHIYNKSKYQQNNPNNNQEEEKKWTTFTYSGNYIRKITNYHYPKQPSNPQAKNIHI
jgi:hypothetical protein